MIYLPAMKVFFLTGVLIFFIGCSSWPKVRIAGDDYLIVPGSHGGNVTTPPKSTDDSGSTSDSDSKGVKPRTDDSRK